MGKCSNKMLEMTNFIPMFQIYKTMIKTTLKIQMIKKILTIQMMICWKEKVSIIRSMQKRASVRCIHVFKKFPCLFSIIFQCIIVSIFLKNVFILLEDTESVFSRTGSESILNAL